ncbi:MAG: hypothetical protein IKK43_03120 [Clostridia bacterium]|nr:hypothetical protein [Clostridia bacterium]
MEYRELAGSWRESLESGNLDEALKRIEAQIATNLMNVHNQLCESKLQSPIDVYAYEMYGNTEKQENQGKMNAFIQINYDFIEIGHGLDKESTYPREQVMKDFEELEDRLRQEMSNI